MLTKLTHRAIVVFTLISSVMAQGGGYALDFAGNDGCSAASCSNFVEVSWSTNMSTYTVSVWVKSNSANPAVWRSYFNSYNQSSDGIQLDCDGSGNYRFLSNAGSDIFGSVVTTWTHIAVSANGSNTYLYYNGSLVTTNSWVENTWNQIELGRNRNEDRPGNYQIDEVRVWNASLTQSQIQAWMHKPIDTNHGNYSNSTSDNLKAYYQMSNGSGTSLTDNSANSNTGTLTNMDNNDWVTSNAPISTLTSDYTTDAEALWSGSGTSASDASNGLNMTVSSTLSEANFAVYGNNNTSGTSTSDIGSVGSTVRTGRIWQVDESGTVAGTVTIDISDATGNAGQSGTASNFRLLYRSGTSGDFSSAATGASISGDVVTFTSVSLADGYYALGAESDATLPVELTSFEVLSTRDNSITLQWITESEINNLGFILDRRVPGTEWTEIATYITHPELQGQGSVSHQTVYTYTDDTVMDNEVYDYRIADVDYDGHKEYHSLQILGVSPGTTVPLSFVLHQNYPNPFNPITSLRYDLPEQAQVTLTIYDLIGREVTQLINTTQEAGYRSVQWNAADMHGKPVSTGVYLYQIQAGEFVQTRKMVLLK